MIQDNIALSSGVCNDGLVLGEFFDVKGNEMNIAKSSHFIIQPKYEEVDLKVEI